MSLDKSRINNIGDSTSHLIPKKEMNKMIDCFVEKAKKARNKKGRKASSKSVETRSQKVSECKRTTLKREIHRSTA